MCDSRKYPYPLHEELQEFLKRSLGLGDGGDFKAKILKESAVWR